MNRISTIKWLISAITRILFMALFINTTVSAQDSDISVTPGYLFFADQIPANLSDPVTITVTNEGYTSGVTLGTVLMNGSHSRDFNLSADNCSAQTLAESTSCTLQVKFAPQSTGIKSTIITIPYNDTNLSVFLSNNEDTLSEVQRRLPPVMVDLNIPEELNATTSYDLNWTAIGYHSGYETLIVMFDCTGVVEGSCGASYESPEKFYESSYLSPSSVTQGEWAYSGEATQNFQYTHPYTIPTTRPADSSPWPDTGTPIVIRLYVNSIEDSEAGKSSLSLIIPGNLSNDYYDTSGRKIQKIICPSGGCTP